MRPFLFSLLMTTSVFASAQSDFTDALKTLPPNPTPAQLTDLDKLAGQKDAIKSRLFWHRSLDDAITQATQENKPILSLRLLGRLDEELSCANSRFFRKTLYVDPTINSLLRSKFVLHWESVRPVPLLTIDFGDGHAVKRTITGNSLHYLMTPKGEVIDCLPGMYDKPTFNAELTRFLDGFSRLNIPNGLAHYHQQTSRRLATIPADVPPSARPADVAGRLAASKAIIERPTLNATLNPSEIQAQESINNQRTLRPQTLSLIGLKLSTAELTKRIYKDVFKAPLDDPDMGLNPPDESALVQN